MVFMSELEFRAQSTIPVDLLLVCLISSENCKALDKVDTATSQDIYFEVPTPYLYLGQKNANQEESIKTNSKMLPTRSVFMFRWVI
jgi:hypothetical protein